MVGQGFEETNKTTRFCEGGERRVGNSPPFVLFTSSHNTVHFMRQKLNLISYFSRLFA